MPQRKLVKHGPSTFIVSLPRAWVDKHGLKKGDEINYEQYPDSIVFYANTERTIRKEVVDVTGLDRTFIMFYLRALYRRGFDEIEINFQEPTVMHHALGKTRTVSSVVDWEAHRLVGIEVSRHDANSITLKQLAEPSLSELGPSMDRLIGILKSMQDNILDAIRSKKIELLSQSEEKHDAITKLVSYCIRGLHQSKRVDDMPYVIHILMQLDVVTDLLKHFSREVMREPYETTQKGIDVLQFFKTVHDLVLDNVVHWDKESLDELDRMRTRIRESLLELYGTHEGAVLNYFLPLLELYRDIMHSRMCVPRELFME